MNPVLELEPLLQHAMGARVRVAKCQVVKQKVDYWVLLARLVHPRIDVVVKLAGPGAQMASQFDRTVAIHRLVAKSSRIPLPEIIAADVSCQKWPWRYLIRAHLPGIEWSALRGKLNQAELLSAYRQLGETIGQLHQIAFPKKYARSWDFPAWKIITRYKIFYLDPPFFKKWHRICNKVCYHGAIRLTRIALSSYRSRLHLCRKLPHLT